MFKDVINATTSKVETDLLAGKLNWAIVSVAARSEFSRAISEVEFRGSVVNAIVANVSQSEIRKIGTGTLHR